MMKNDEDLQRIERLFQAAADLSPAERTEFLDRECGDELEVRARVEALLKKSERSETFTAPGLDEVALTEGPGTEIGRYKLLQVIGDGGFGVVYMAAQEQPLVRKVALKIIKLGMDTKEVIARFEAERQALAMMEHPNIARVLDGGATDTGRPYFVMELVRGISITDYCDRNRLDTRERLELFMQVCHAVQHAHQKGVIHRDLKPSNVMVTMHDGKPIPKVIDFGIAKAMHTRLTERTLFTEYQRFIGTPAYMSPEQAEMSALDIDTRTDIYSLGVLLYELLTGTTPFETSSLMRAGLAEIQRIIREEPPERPSLRISTSGDATVAGMRKLDVDGLSKRLRGDLDWIAMKALEKERVRRYATASELATDVQRHLQDEPVHAGPPGRVYKLRKYVSRHRTAVTTTGLLGLVLVVGVIGTTLGMVEAGNQRDAAQREAANARTTVGFLADTLALTDPDVALDPNVSVRTLLDRAGERVAASFDGRPRAEARVRSTIGLAYKSIGEHELAETHLRQAIELVNEIPEYDSTQLYNALWALTQVSFRLDRSDAFAVAYRARQVGNAVIGESHPELSAVLEQFLRSLQEGDIDTGHALFAQTASRADEELAADDPLWLIVADSLMAGGFSLWYSPLEGESAPFYAKALEIRRRMLPPNHPLIGEAVAQLVGVLNRSGQAPAAEAQIRESIALLREVYLEGHWQLAYARSLLGECLTMQGKYEEAEQVLLDSHTDLVAHWTVSNFFGFDSFVRIVSNYDAWGKPERASPYRERLLSSTLATKQPLPWSITRLLFGPEHAPVVEQLSRLNELSGGFGIGAAAGEVRAPEVETVVSELARIRPQILPTDHPLSPVIAIKLLAWANTLAADAPDQGRRLIIEEANRILSQWHHSLPLEAADALALMSSLAAEDGDDARASRMARDAAGLLLSAPTGGDWGTALTKVRIGRQLSEQGLFAAAEAIVEPSYEILEAQLGPEHAGTQAARALLVDLYTAWGKPDKVRTYAPIR